MKIAIICPVGDLNRFGYWRTARLCLESWRAVGDLFVIHSSRTALPFSIKCEYLRDESTLMPMFNDAERFDHRLVASNANRGITAARKAGYDAALTICANWYVEQEAGARIAEKCWQMIGLGVGCDFLYRRFQIGAQLFDADLASIVALNLSHQLTVKVLVDKLAIDGALVETERGHYAAHNDEAYIDCEHELTTAELQEKLADVRNYEDILPKRHGADWSFWERYYQARASTMRASSNPLGAFGRAIAEQHPAGAFGDWLIEQMAAVTA